MLQFIKFIYPANVEVDSGGWYLVTFPDIPFAVTDGKTLDEALIEAEDCLEEAIATCIKDAEPIPTPSEVKDGQYPIRLSTLISAKAVLYIAMKEERIGKAELARRIGVAEREVQRLLDTKHQTKIPRIEKALALLGWRLNASFEKLEQAA